MCAFLLLSFPRHKPERADLNVSSLNYLLSSTSRFNLPAVCVSSSSSNSRISISFSSLESTFASKPRLCNSLIRTLNDSGTPASGTLSPLTIDSYVFTRPTTSSDFTVRISWSVYAAPYASSAQTSISPKRCPPNCALPPSGCCVTSEYGPVERACNLSSTICDNFSMYITPTEILLSNGSPVRPSYNTVLPSRAIPASSIVDHTSSSLAPSNTGDATWIPKFLAAIPK